MARSHFGSVEELKGKPGFYCRFRYAGRRVRRYGGPTKKEACDKLALAQILANRNRSLHEILEEVFAEGDTEALTFASAARNLRVDPGAFGSRSGD